MKQYIERDFRDGQWELWDDKHDNTEPIVVVSTSHPEADRIIETIRQFYKERQEGI